MDISGSWETLFEVNTEDSYPAVGVFDQKDNSLTGTFMTKTGDYRFLEGTIQGEKIYLSCFDGSHAFLFEAKIQEDSSLYGIFRSGNHYITEWTAERNEGYQLPAAYDLTSKKEANVKLDFSYYKADGSKSSFSEFLGNNKAKLVQIMGTWCPNCKDESNYLKSFYQSGNTDSIQIISVCFERYKNVDDNLRQIEKYKKKMDIPYDMVLGGYYSKDTASAVFPMLTEIISYPTLLFVNKDHEIIKIHTGFNGPATPFYKSFEEEFNQIISSL